MLRIQLSRKLWTFIVWTTVTCSLLGIQKLNYENTAVIASIQSEVFFTEQLSTPHNNYQNASDEVSSTVPFHPFVDGKPKMLVVLTYQRSGSTFFGRIFNQNPDVFYTFEPLDAFYSSLYGTAMCWNVPSDITNHKNGTIRTLPKIEVEGVSKYLSSLLSCNLSSLPPEMLLHPYIYYYGTDEYQAAESYIKCIGPYESSMKQCADRSPTDRCGFRLGDRSQRRLFECHRAIHHHHHETRPRGGVNKQTRRKDIEEYVTCMRALKQTVEKNCLSHLQRQCDLRVLRVAKIVRGTMLSMEVLLRRHPNFRVVHLVRDPRAVVLSRREFDSSALGGYSLLDLNDTLAREAKLFCQSVVRDIRVRVELEQKYPGRIYPIVYDDMVRGLEGVARSLYRFLDYPDQQDTDWWKRTIQPLETAESIRRATKWQSLITFEQNMAIMQHCGELFRLAKAQHWPQ